MEFRYARHPNRLDAENPRIIEDLLELAQQDQGAVNSIIQMLEDLLASGTQSRYCKKLKNLPFWELKTRSRGGVKGGARLYFAVVDGDAVLFNAEFKTGDLPSAHKLEEAAEILLAHRQGVGVF
jgi:hypothetical protein